MLDIEDTITKEQYANIQEYLHEHLDDVLNWKKFSLGFQKKYRCALNKNQLRNVYMNEVNNKMYAAPPRELIKKASRSQYGILNVCVFTSPYPEYTDENGVKQKQMFSCKHDCYYCPNEPGQPRSYLKDEPGVARANDCDFDCIRQFHMRLNQYKGMGHPIDKLEFEVSGGTWSEYPREYQLEFIRDGYYAANVYFDPLPYREKLSLEQEIYINETTTVKIIGLTLETRPDSINLEEIERLRNYNVTRLQIGIQHTNNKILKKINRGHTIEESMEAIKLLLDNGFKVDIHIMPMLPGSTPESDSRMFDTILHNDNLQVDQWKVYPCSVVPWSVLETQYKSGKYHPYSNDELFDVLYEMKLKVHRRIRLIRIVRDINDHYISGGCQVSHMRQLLHKKLDENKEICKCIRCRSCKTNIIDPNYKLKIDKFNASGGIEYFISYISEDETVLYGFCRLRLTNDIENQMKEIHHCALIRELHVYSTLIPVNKNKDKGKSIQHRGFGKRLLKEAEKIAITHGYVKSCVISGVGVRNYYRKFGYELDTTYMIKKYNVFQFIIMYVYYNLMYYLNKK